MNEFDEAVLRQRVDQLEAALIKTMKLAKVGHGGVAVGCDCSCSPYNDIDEIALTALGTKLRLGDSKIKPWRPK